MFTGNRKLDAVDSVVGLATRYGLDGPGIESRTRPDRPWGPPSLVYEGYRVFIGGKAAGAWCWPPAPIFSAEVIKWVELYFGPGLRALAACYRENLYLTLRIESCVCVWVRCLRICVEKPEEFSCLYVLFNFLIIKISHHGDYLSRAKFRTNVPAIFWGMFAIFCGNSKFMFIATTISHRSPNNVLRCPGWGTLVLVLAIIIFWS